MTLKEQFIDAFKSGKRFDIQNAEVIAEEFAIGFAEWCIKKRVDFFDDTEIGETYTIDGFVSRYKMEELLEIYKIENDL
jgi:hypothetical protein